MEHVVIARCRYITLCINSLLLQWNSYCKWQHWTSGTDNVKSTPSGNRSTDFSPNNSEGQTGLPGKVSVCRFVGAKIINRFQSRQLWGPFRDALEGIGLSVYRFFNWLPGNRSTDEPIPVPPTQTELLGRVWFYRFIQNPINRPTHSNGQTQEAGHKPNTKKPCPRETNKPKKNKLVWTLPQMPKYNFPRTTWFIGLLV